MGYIGSDPKTNESVSTAQLVDDSVTNAKIVDNVLFTSVTSSVVSASNTIIADTFTGTFSGALSSSAQISSDISGSFTAASSSFSSRTTTLESASGSDSTRITTLEGRVNQGVKTTDSPTFAGATVTGTLTANEIHTTFVSSSVATITGSNVFGDAVGDLHSFTGSVSISGSQTSLVTAGSVDVASTLTTAKNITVDYNDSTSINAGEIAGDNDVLGINIKNQNTGNGSGGMLKFIGGNGDNLTAIGHVQEASNSASMLFFTETGGTFAERMRVDHSGLIGIGTNGPASMLHLHGTDPILRFQDSAGGDVFGIYNSDSLGLGFYNFTDSRQDVTIDGSGNVGIGVTSPSSLLHVSGTSGTVTHIYGTSSPTLLFEAGAGDPNFIFKQGGSNRFLLGYEDSDAGFRFYDYESSTTMLFLKNGKVGIGSTSPGANLDVGHATDSRIRMTRTDSTVVADESLGSIQFAADDPSAGAVGASIQSKASSAWSSNNYGAYIRFLTTPDNSGDQAERMRITEDGYVGIGTDNPGMQLQIRGSGTQQARIYSTDGVGRFVIRGATQGDLFLHDESGGTNLKQVQLVQVDDLFKIRQITDAGGLGRENLLVIMPEANNVGIGTATPTIGSGRGLHIRAPEANLHAGIRLDTPSGGDWSIIAVDNDDRLLFYDNENSQYGLAIDENAHVGIGLTSPNVRLHVRKSGNGKAGNIARFAQENDSDSVLMYGRGTGAYGASSADTCLAVATMETTGRSINAGGTINASGADYAEYETKRDDCGTIEKGDIVGFDTNGLITDKWTNAVTFGIKSTNPSYVGGDTWGVGVSSGSIETERQKVDRIAYSGKVPCNVTGSNVGDYIIPIQVGDGIGGVAKSSPTYDEYKQSVGVVRTISGSLPIVVVKTL